eukprot:jgi/Chrzof1/3780/Cz13g08150.t1
MMGRQSQQQSRDDSKDDQHRRLLFEDLWRIRKSNGEYPDHAMKPGETLSGTVAAARKSASTRFHNIQDAFTSSTQTAKEYIDFFRHAIKDPDDAAAQTLGRMMSKDYGRHEPSHTEHHLWRNSPPSSSSHIIKAEIKDDASLQQDKLKFTCCDESKDVCKP